MGLSWWCEEWASDILWFRYVGTLVFKKLVSVKVISQVTEKDLNCFLGLEAYFSDYPGTVRSFVDSVVWITAYSKKHFFTILPNFQ